MKTEHVLNICLHNSNKEIECSIRFIKASHSVEIKWNNSTVEIDCAMRSMGKTHTGNNDPLVRYVYGTGNKGQKATRYLLTVNCGFRIPLFNLLDIANQVEHFSFQIDHEQQIKLDEFIDNLPIMEQYPTEDYLFVKNETATKMDEIQV